MKNYKVLLCDTEEGFVVALMNYMNRNPGIPMLAMAFTQLDTMLEYLNSHKADLIVINAEWNKEGVDVSGITIPILWILEEKPEKQKEQEGSNYISKYTAAPVYTRRMLQLLSEHGSSMRAEGNGTCIAVYSPLGRCGKTRLTHELCKSQTVCYESPKKKGIYIGMEEFCEPMENEHGMETLLYYIKQRTANISMKVKSLAVEGPGYDILVSALTYQELRELERKEFQWFLECIRREDCYDMLFADIGSGSLPCLELLLDFDAVYLPYLQDEHSRLKVQAFCRALKQYGIWESLSMKCFPILIEGDCGYGKEVLLLEQRRNAEDLAALDDLYENMIKDVEREAINHKWNSNNYVKR